ncbi:SusC/RagA family TonB-linked outer membrane protein [Terrimonas sp.]|uniref:SusC/RagA family TonB-linked outer membrane protein n=1 Tax=Terrimonas sp. TaxID=1914338 RepID=UPI001401DECF|nr:SusC/RagA family TonB-linked outer membrane protein [Terrimonas sp.]
MKIEARVRNHLTLFYMKLIPMMLLLVCLQATTRGYGQTTVTLNLNNSSLENALKDISSQTGYSFIYTRAQLKHSQNITAQLKNISLQDALDKCFFNQPLHYTIEDKYVVVIDKLANGSPLSEQTIDVSGKVVDEKSNALLRITVTTLRSKKSTYTNEKGEFTLKDVFENDILVFTSVGYTKAEIPIDKKTFHNITMKLVIGLLDETVIMAYGKTTRRLNTGNIGKVSSDVISQQPVLDPLSALHGKVPGLVVTQSSGLPGASIKIQIRGQNSLTQGSEPLIIVDGVPLATNNQPVNALRSLLSGGGQIEAGLSPIAGINPLDIESIEILKDADATAIYGSRGANGVLLITTKRGAPGKTMVFANFYTSWSKVPKLPKMLNTTEYLQMRREAFANDGLAPSENPSSPGYAPDLFLWDTTRETNFSKTMLGNAAHSYNGQAGLSGGSENMKFFFSAGHNKDGTIFPGDMGSDRISLSNNLNYSTNNKKLTFQLSTNYSSLKNNLIASSSLNSFLALPPNTPSLYTPDGKLNWQEGGYSFTNPLAYLLQKYNAVTDNLISNLQINYKITKGLSIRSSFGYNSIQVSEKSLMPIASQDPAYNPQGSQTIANSSNKGWIIEPQTEYETTIGKGRLNLLVGSTFSQQRQNVIEINASGYNNDQLIDALSAASFINSTNRFSDYKYTALFGRINYNWRQKYIINFTGRRDGSSRFGPGKRFANLGAVGAAWLFQEEHLIQKILPFLSYGKIRASYGLTGNDQIGNYKYLDMWAIDYKKYQETTALYPSELFNPQYGWETNRKFEISLDLSFLKDRIYFSSTYFNNKSGNQLVNYSLPAQTGFGSIISNFPAVVENKGFEFVLEATPIDIKNFKWSFAGNVSVPSNKLLSFPNLNTSSYQTTYVEGKSLSIIYKLHSLGVDPSTGVFLFEDTNNDNIISMGTDYQVTGKTDPRFYGGVRNTLAFKKIELDIFFDFRKQTGFNYLNAIYGNAQIPGFATNQPTYVLERWQKPGDLSMIQMFTTNRRSAAYQTRSNYRYSDAVYSDASYIRLRTISISWRLPTIVFKKISTNSSRIFVSAQNLFTISNYKGTDPEIQNYYSLPSLRTIAIGAKLNF